MSLPTRAYRQISLRQLTSEVALIDHSLQQEELVTAYSRKSFEQQSFQQDELELACLLSPTRASQLHSFEQMELPIESFIHQLDLETSLSLPWFSLPRSRSQLQTDSLAEAASSRELYLVQLCFTNQDQHTEQISSELSAFNSAA